MTTWWCTTASRQAPPPVARVTGDASALEPVVIVLREEVPQIQMQVRAYERVTVHVNRVVSSVAVTGDVRHEEIAVDTTPVPGSAAR